MKFNVKKRTICFILAIYMCIFSSMCIPCSAASYHYYTNTTTPNFLTTNLDKLYNESGVYASVKWYDRIHDAGCYVTSYAMVLRSLGKKTIKKVKDIRSSSTGYLGADPFTVTYANAGFPSIVKSSNGNFYAEYTGDPVYTSPSTIASNFGATFSQVDLRGKEDSVKAYNLASYINKYPQGVVICFTSHAVVGIGTTYPTTRSAEEILPEIFINDPNFKDYDFSSSFLTVKTKYEDSKLKNNASMNNYGIYFTVCDPVSAYNQSGDNVLLSDCWTGDNFNFSDIQYIRIMK